jgi:MurNAc alpha-1-phosphate uridylyltransferase
MIRPRTAMLLAAGLGTRMRPLTDDTAKALLPLKGRPLMDHALDRLAEAGVERVVVNTHWQGELVAAHLSARIGPPAIETRPEAALQDTGGAVRDALDALGPDPFYVVNGDAFWLDGPRPALIRLADAWTEAVDALLLVHRGFQVAAEIGNGDFQVDPWGVVRRPLEQELVPYVFAGLQLLHPRLFQGAPDGPFSLNRLWDDAIAADRLRAVVHDGLWFHLSTPPDLAEAEDTLQARNGHAPR